tara:strand:+ start:123 stop:566 length:444 start_codon:yes stop_codon:yes gene_type:complete
MIKIVIAVLLIAILCIKIYDVIMKYRESYKNVFNFKCVVVSTDKLRKKGLMYRKKKLKDSQGMLFDFKEPMAISLWMKNTFIPLDAIYLNEDGKIVDINEGLKPKSKKSVKSDKLARYVMEVNSKTVKNKNIKLGDYIQIEKIKKLD